METLGKVLTELNLQPAVSDDQTNFFVDFGGSHLPVADALAAIVVESQRFVFYLNLGLAALPEQRDTIARFITRANWGLTIGNFEMDYQDGHIRFKTSVDFEDSELNEALIRNSILSAMTAMEAYGDELVTMAAADARPQGWS
jgi:hypothetical protein